MNYSHEDENYPLTRFESMLKTNDILFFDSNEFENIIDGQTIVSGIGLIFTQEFNKFSELWEAILYNETKAEKLERDRLKKEQKLKDKEKIDPENENINNN